MSTHEDDPAQQHGPWLLKPLAVPIGFNTGGPDEPDLDLLDCLGTVLDRLDTRHRGVHWTPGSDVGHRRELAPCRTVRAEGGSQWSAKLDRRVEYESKQEQSFLSLADAAPAVASFCEQPTGIRYTWQGEHHLYVPDVALLLDDGRCVLVELKPRTLWADAVNVAKWDAALRWCRNRGWGFAVYDNRRHPVDIVALASDEDFELLESLCEAGPARSSMLGQRWFRSGRSWDLLLATALKYGFAVERNPFRVQPNRSSPWLMTLR